MPKLAPYGTWISPITTAPIAGKTTPLIELALDGDDIYWIERRPAENGRHTILRRTPDGTIRECTPPDYSVRTTVHEYGGGAFTVADGTIYFTNFQDQHLYRQRPGERPEALTSTDGYRYADLTLDGRRKRLICIREDHTGRGEAVNSIVAVSLSGGDSGTILMEGNDFYSTARLSPDGTKLAYLTWNHPNMPWDGCELWVALVRPNGMLDHPALVAGSASESIFQPAWSPDGILHFVAETTGWWNLYRWRASRIEALCPMQAEFGSPQWDFDMSTYDFASPTRILCSYSQGGTWHLAWLDTGAGELTPMALPYTEISDVRVGSSYAIFMAGSPLQPLAVVRMATGSAKIESLKRISDAVVEEGYISIPEPRSFPTTGAKEAHGFYYPPRNKDFVAQESEPPPLIVIAHGGPTGAAPTTLRYSLQFWTSRGFAVLDVNYGGSTGYGRAYRQRLNANWGVVDVDDCCAGAAYLVEHGLADPMRLIIRGSSAGGYTALACLAFRSHVFKAAASHYGIADLARLALETHKFESHYLESLVGPYPERRDLYFARSPINFTKNLECPLILFQGDEDKVVSPAQSQLLYDAVRDKGLPVAILLFHGEQHGFRKAENIQRALEAELYFYSRIFGFEPGESIESVTIENLSPSENV